MSDDYQPRKRSWREKIADAVRGIGGGICGQASFLVHIPVAVLVVIAALVFKVSLVEWFFLLGCIGAVIAAELFNSCLEHLARAIDRKENDHLRVGLNIASGAVLVVAITAAIVGLLVFVPHLLELLGSLRE